MANKKVLVQWIGHSDLRALAASLPPAKKKEILDVIRGEEAAEGDIGPTKTLLSKQQFDEVHLLSNYKKTWNTWFQKWLKTPTNMIEVELEKPTDYDRIFKIADEQLSLLKASSKQKTTELCLHLSPGTPAMAAVWLLLGKTRFPATFYETHRGKWWITNVPFDLVDVIPDVLDDPDKFLQKLTSESPQNVKGFEDIIGESKAIREAVGRSKRVAMHGVSVLLLGESGTGKELFAQAIHKVSPRRKEPFRAVNCGALPMDLLQSELFGHTQGAFTGADKGKKGLFESANGGTLFLDEVGECDLDMQAALLRVLQPVVNEGPTARRIRPVGAAEEIPVDVRIIAATNRDLHKAIAEGTFREDLYFRLSTMAITLPPLRERRSDVLLIANYLLESINRQFEAESRSTEVSYTRKTFSASANRFLKDEKWPGNVRQLYNTLLQSAVLAEGDRISRRELAASLAEIPNKNNDNAGVGGGVLGDGFDLEKHIVSIRKKYFQRAMEEARGKKRDAANLLGLKYETFRQALERLGMHGEWDK